MRSQYKPCYMTELIAGQSGLFNIGIMTGLGDGKR